MSLLSQRLILLLTLLTTTSLFLDTYQSSGKILSMASMGLLCTLRQLYLFLAMKNWNCLTHLLCAFVFLFSIPLAISLFFTALLLTRIAVSLITYQIVLIRLSHSILLPIYMFVGTSMFITRIGFPITTQLIKLGEMHTHLQYPMTYLK